MNTTFFDNDGGGGAAKQEFVRRVVRTVARAVLTKLQRAAEQETLQRATEVQNARAEYESLIEISKKYPQSFLKKTTTMQRVRRGRRRRSRTALDWGDF